MGKVTIEIEFGVNGESIKIKVGEEITTLVSREKEIPKLFSGEIINPITLENKSPITIGKHIRKRRKSIGWTLRDLGKKTGLSISYLSEAETGRSAMSIKAAEKVSSALGINMSDLFKK